MDGCLARDVLPTGVRSRRSARSLVLPLVLVGELACGVGLRAVWEAATPEPRSSAAGQPAGAPDPSPFPPTG